MAVGLNALTGITFLNEVLDKSGHSWEPETTTYYFGRFGFPPVALKYTCVVGSYHGSTDCFVIGDNNFVFAPKAIAMPFRTGFWNVVGNKVLTVTGSLVSRKTVICINIHGG